MTDLNTLLLEEQANLKTESQELREQISAAERKLKKVTERLELVEGLLEPIHALEDDSGENPLPDYRDIRDIAEDILKLRGGEPMHYAKLAEAIQACGGEIPGVNAANTLLSRLVRDDRFVRPKRGHYALREDHPNTISVGARSLRRAGDNGEVEEL